MSPALEMPPAECRIEPSSHGSLMALTAAVAGVAKGGVYEFEIRTVAPDGSTSTNMQGGEIDAGLAEPQVLGRVMVGYALRSWSARLTIYAPDGTSVCTAKLP